MISFTVFGNPQTAGSKRAFALRRKDGSVVTRPGGQPVINVTDDNVKSRDWKHTVSHVAYLYYKGPLLLGPLAVSMVFYRPRPQAHWKSDRAKGLTKVGEACIAPISKPDVLKMARAIEDALTGVLWRDDAQIVSESLTKAWGEPARVDIRVEQLTSGAVRLTKDAEIERALEGTE